MDREKGLVTDISENDKLRGSPPEKQASERTDLELSTVSADSGDTGRDSWEEIKGSPDEVKVPEENFSSSTKSYIAYLGSDQLYPDSVGLELDPVEGKITVYADEKQECGLRQEGLEEDFGILSKLSDREKVSIGLRELFKKILERPSKAVGQTGFYDRKVEEVRETPETFSALQYSSNV